MGETDRRISLRYPGVCRFCDRELPVRTDAIYDWSTKTLRCIGCSAGHRDSVQGSVARSLPHATLPSSSGVAGSSARRVYEQRKANDEERLRQRWGRLGGIAVALAEERPSTTSWAKGAVGEERLGRRLSALESDRISVLHDRRMPRSQANIDHIVVTRGGVWVIDAKRYKGRPTLRIEGGLIRPRVERLLVGRRDCTRLVDGVLRQVDQVQRRIPGVPVTGALCFVEADWPLFGGAFNIGGVDVLWSRRLTKRLAAADGSVDVQAVRRTLTSHFKPA